VWGAMQVAWNMPSAGPAAAGGDQRNRADVAVGGHYPGLDAEEVADVIATWSVEQLADGTSRVVVTGEVDLAVEEPFVAEVDSVAAARDGGTAVVLDLRGVTFLDSSGVRALIRLRQRHGERLRLGELSTPVRRVLEITGLLQPFGAE
jgi:anti-anti-sigma factor